MGKIDPSTLSDEQRKALKAIKDERDKRFQMEQKRHRIVIIILLIVVILLSIRDSSTQNFEILPPDFSTVEDEPNAYLNQNNQDQTEASQANGAVALVFADEVTYRVNDNLVLLHYSNAASSKSVSILQIVVHDPDGYELLLAQSGVLRPGYSVDALPGASNETADFDSGSYTGVMRILFFDENRADNAIAKTDIPVTITVE